MALLSSTWIDLHEMETIVQDKHGRRKTKVQKIRSRAIVISSVAEETTQEGTTVYAWKVRPGDVFAPFLLGPGKQLAMLSQKVLEYDFAKYQWEKRIARYLFWLGRIRQGKGDYLKPVRVRSILEAIKKEVDQRYPNRFRERFEAALSRLVEDGVLQGWQYAEVDDSIMERRGWWQEWLDWLVIVELPQQVFNQYEKIAMPLKEHEIVTLDVESKPADDLVARLKQCRLNRGMTQLQVAVAIGVNANYLAQLERRVKRPSDQLAAAIERWIAAGA
jgi:DNA-binding XRE family transcriptional regulator